MERREWHELCNRGHLPVFRNIRAPRGGGLLGARLFLGSRQRGSRSHRVHGQPRDKRTAGSVPLVLEVKSQGQLEVKLDCPALVGPTQGVLEVHIDLGVRMRGCVTNENQCLRYPRPLYLATPQTVLTHLSPS